MYILKIQIMGLHNTKFVYFLKIKLLPTIYINKKYTKKYNVKYVICMYILKMQIMDFNLQSLVIFWKSNFYLQYT